MATPTTWTVVKVDPAQLANSNATLYTVAANTNGAKITSIMLVNDSTTPMPATIYLVPSGGSAADTNILCKGFSVPADGLAYEVLQSCGEQFLEPSSLITGFATTADVVTYHISLVLYD
jgi:hypothetical protein